MENIESPARPNSMNLLTRPIERNVLRELNSIEATKSPKEPSLADQTEIHAKDIQLPVIHTNNRLSDGSDKAPVYKNLLRVATPTGTFVNSEQHVPNESNGPGISNKKLNLGFIESRMSGVDMDADKSTDDAPNSEVGECGSKDSKDSKISSSFIEDSQITDNEHHNQSLGGNSNYSNGNSSTEDTTVPVITMDGVFASQTTIDGVAAVVPEVESASMIESAVVIESNPVINVESKPIIEAKPVLESTLVIESTPVISAVESVAPMESEFGDRPVVESVMAINVDVESVIETMPAVESAIESAVVIESNPAINGESKPLIEHEPVSESKSVISAVESESPMELELTERPLVESDSLTNINVESVINTMPAVESTIVDPSKSNEVASIIESAVVIESNPVINDEALMENESVPESTLEIESAPVMSAIESESPTESELADRPVVKSDINMESVIETMPAVESTIESAVAIESNPEINVESKPIIETEPVLESTLVIESTPVISAVESVAPMESELADRSVVESDSLRNVNVASVIETMPAVESAIESAVVIESNPVINDEPKPSIETGPVVESTLVIESTPVISAIESVAPMETELADRPEVESVTAISVDVDPLIETIPEIESTTLHPSEPTEDVIQSPPIIESAVVPVSNTEINAEPSIESDTVIKTELEIEAKSANESEPSRESENVCESAISISPVIQSETAIDAESTNKLDPSIESVVIGQSEPTQSEVVNRSAPESDPEATIESQPLTELEPVAKCELAQANNALNVTCNLDGTSICQPETTFFASNDEITPTVRIEASSSNRELEVETTIAAESETIDDAKVTQANKISEFKANQSFSVDSLDQDTEPQDCSLDSLEMKVDNPSISALCSDITERFQRLNTFDLPNPVGANFEHPGAVNLNESVSTLSRKDTFSVSSPQNESIPSISRQDTYSLLLPPNENINSPLTTLSGQDSQSDSCSSVDDITVLLNKVAINSPIVNAADSSNRMKRSATFKKSNSDDVNQNSTSMSADGSSASGSKLQTTPVPNLNAIDSKQDDLPEMVLSPNDFDFLQSRGGKKAISEEDRRSSLLLRFDPMSGRPQRQHLTTTEEVVESSVATDSEDTSQPSESSTKNISNEQSSSKAESSTANASEMSVSLVHDSKSMDNDTTNSFKNNLKADIAGGVTMTDKKIEFEYADENIRKKMEEYEASQEILVKRLAEKEKTLAKNCAIIEVYEKTLAELVADKEKLTDHHEVTNERLRQERDIHHQHLMSLEITFSDLHKKYERSKEIIMQLRERYDVLSEERAMIDHLIKQQELRYEKMKQHAIEQLEHANSTLEEQEKSNARENSRLKALLKIEECQMPS